MTASFNGSMASFIIPIITGTLSTIGSFLILNIILQSAIKLGTTHHRIMASMSVFDIIASICMVLSTLPMPSDTVFRNGRPMWGNKTTCQIQGFFIVLGFSGGAFLYNCLAWYMVCKITFRMNDYTIRYKIEPYMLIVAIALALSGAIFFLEQDLINPSSFNSFCSVAPYSEDCNDDSVDAWTDCVSGDGRTMKAYERSLIIMAVIVTTNVVLIFVAMFLIIKTVCNEQKKMKKAKKQISDTNAPCANVIITTDDSTSDNHEHQQYNTTDLKYSRVLILQALMYILAFFITWIFMILCILLGNDYSFFLDMSKAVLLPLQGFWNMIIFVYDKVFLLRQVDPSKTWWQAVKNVLFCPHEIPVAFLTNLAIIEETTRNAGDPELSQVSKDEEVFCSPTEVTLMFPINLTMIEESRYHGDAVPSIVSDKDILLLLETQKIQHHEQTTNSLEGNPLGSTSSNVIDFQSSLSGSKLSSDLSSTEVIRNDGVDYLGMNNLRFYLDSNGLRRTGAVEDRRNGRAGVQSTVSIESPSGLIGDDDSIGEFASPSDAISNTTSFDP